MGKLPKLKYGQRETEGPLVSCVTVNSDNLDISKEEINDPFGEPGVVLKKCQVCWVTDCSGLLGVGCLDREGLGPHVVRKPMPEPKVECTFKKMTGQTSAALLSFRVQTSGFQGSSKQPHP